MDWLVILEKAVWFGLAALGFATLFNVPVRTMFSVFLIAALGGVLKTALMQQNVNIVAATLAAAIVVGMLCIPAAHNRHSPPMVFAIPSVIPMVPGVLAYRTVIGLIKLAGTLPVEEYNKMMAETVNNGLKTIFVLMSLAGGVAIPMMVVLKKSVKHVRLKIFPKEEKSV